MSCNCNKKSNCKCKSGNVCDPSFTGGIKYDGEDFECNNEPTLDTPSNTPLNTILSNIWNVLCALTGMNAANVGSGAGVFRDKVGYLFNFRSIVGGPGVTVVENADEIEIQIDSIGSFVQRTVFCASDALGPAAGSTVSPGTALPSTTYVVPPGEGGTFEVYYSVMALSLKGETCELRGDVNGVEIDPNAKRQISTVDGVARHVMTLHLCGFVMADGDTFDIKGYKSTDGNRFDNGVIIIKRIA
jgi:hypothetical protein